MFIPFSIFQKAVSEITTTALNGSVFATNEGTDKLDVVRERDVGVENKGYGHEDLTTTHL